MNHPHEQLADLLDGTLDEGSLAGVQAHLDTCDGCRADVEAARRGREAARSLPVAEPPGDLHERVVAAAGGGGRGGAPRWYRWVGAAAAAAVVLAIAIALPDVGNDDASGGSAAGVTSDSSGGGTEAGAEVQPSEASRVALNIQDLDYDQATLQDLASRERRSADAVKAEDSSGPATLAADTETAARCVRKAFDGQPSGELTQMIEATFDGRDAYIAVYLEGPGAGQAADTVAVYAASRDDCQLLSFASARI
jgi:anti-sigma factor RsiW